MVLTYRNTSGAVRFPIVDVDALLAVLKSPQVTAPLYGVRRHAVEKAAQILLEAKRLQTDGEVVLLQHQIGSVLYAAALTLEWQAELLQKDYSDDGE